VELLVRFYYHHKGTKDTKAGRHADDFFVIFVIFVVNLMVCFFNREGREGCEGRKESDFITAKNAKGREKGGLV
jgi:hypothetical protein